MQTLLAAYDSISAAGTAVSEIIAAGIIPAAVEMMDALAIKAAEAAVHPNFPPADTDPHRRARRPGRRGARALRDGREHLPRARARRTVEVAADEAHRLRIWKGRKAAFAAMGRVSPNYYVQDGVVPRTKLPEVLGRIRALSERSGLGIGNVFHAGDGNLHPLICYDESMPGQAELAEQVAGEILTYCVEAGGSITGEHGVGADKKDYMPRMFSDDDLDVMQQVRDAFDPQRLCNPGKVLPTPRLCGEVPGPVPRSIPSSAPGWPNASDGRRRTIADRARPRDAIDGVTPRLRRRAGDRARPAPRCSPPRPRDRTATVIRGGGTKTRLGPAGRTPWIWWCPRPRARRSARPSRRRPDGDRRRRRAAGAPQHHAGGARAVAAGGLARSPAPPSAASLATNDSGPLRHRFGTPRDLLIGITLALTDGRVVKSGGTVVKNVAGYDLGKLVTGSYGALAAIVDATFKLLPLPHASATLRARLRAIPAALAADAAALAAGQLEPLAFDVRAADTPDGPRWTLLVRFASSPAAVSSQIDARAGAAARRDDRAARRAGGARLGRAGRRCRGTRRRRAVVRCSWLPSRLGDVLALARGR